MGKARYSGGSTMYHFGASGLEAVITKGQHGTYTEVHISDEEFFEIDTQDL